MKSEPKRATSASKQSPRNANGKRGENSLLVSAALISASRPAPPAPAPDISEIDELLLMEAFSQDLGLDLEQLKFSHHELERLRPDERLTYLFECARASNIMPPDIELNQVQHMFQIFKINVGAMLSYMPQSKAGRITLLRADQHPSGHDHTAGWTAFATEGVEVHVVEGNHFNMVREPFVKGVAAQLRACLDAAFEETQSVALVHAF